MRVHTALTAALLVAAATAISAASDLDSVLVPGDRLTTRLQLGERRTVSVAGVPGQKLSVLVKRGKGSSVEPLMTVADPFGADVDPGRRLKLSTKSARLAALPITTAGRWRIGFSAPAGGGDVQVRVSGNPPSRLRLVGTTAAADVPVERTFFVLPGSEVGVKVKTKGKPAWEPALEIAAPSGARIPLPPGKRGGVSVTLDELGEHRLLVTGGPGDFSAQLKIRPPRVKGRALQYADVEALPVLTGFSPSSVRNDDETIVLELTGFGFSAQHSVTISSEERSYASAKLSIVPGGAKATIDTTGVPPGELRVGVRTAVGTSVYADDPIEVTNRAPGLQFASPFEFGAFSYVPLELTGSGFDADCTVELFRASDGAEIPADVVLRELPDYMELDLWPPAYQVGKYDVVVTDPSGSSQTYPGYLDVVGFRAEPVDVLGLEVTERDAMERLHVIDAAYDASSDRVLAAVILDRDVRFLLLDGTTLETLQTYAPPVVKKDGYNTDPSVAWDPVEDTWAMTWVSYEGSESGYVRVCDADDLDDELSKASVAKAFRIGNVDVDANDDDGGFVAVAQTWDGIVGSIVTTTHVEPDGTIDTENTSTIWTSSVGAAWIPRIVYRGDGRYVVAFLGANVSETDYALRRIVVRDDGTLAQASLQLAAATDWTGLVEPTLAVNPDDGSVLCAFSYVEAGTVRPAFVLLTGPSSGPEVIQTRASDGLLPVGVATSVVWSPERGEFVYFTNIGGVVEIRRIRPDGTLGSRGYPPLYEGGVAAAWSGPEAGQMGFLRAYDGDETNGYTDFRSNTAIVRAGRIR